MNATEAAKQCLADSGLSASYEEKAHEVCGTTDAIELKFFPLSGHEMAVVRVSLPSHETTIEFIPVSPRFASLTRAAVPRQSSVSVQSSAKARPALSLENSSPLPGGVEAPSRQDRESRQDQQAISRIRTGTEPAPAPRGASGDATNSRLSRAAIASFLLVIVAFLPGMTDGLLLLLSALVLGHYSNHAIRRSSGGLKGRGLAYAALVFSYLGLAMVLHSQFVTAPKLREKLRTSKAKSSMRQLSLALHIYAGDHGRFPDSLATLLQTPDTAQFLQETGQRRAGNGLVDPWGNDFEYSGNQDSFSLRSLGPDRKKSPDDLITNER